MEPRGLRNLTKSTPSQRHVPKRGQAHSVRCMPHLKRLLESGLQTGEKEQETPSKILQSNKNGLFGGQQEEPDPVDSLTFIEPYHLFGSFQES